MNYGLIYIYAAGDERIWTFEFGKNQSCWTIRDLGGKVLRDYFNDGTWTASNMNVIEMKKNPFNELGWHNHSFL